MHWHLANPTINLTRFGRISEKCPDSRFVGVEIGYNQWRRSKFILRGRNFFPQREGDEARGPREGVVFLGRGSEPPAHQLGGVGSTVSSPNGVRG